MYDDVVYAVDPQHVEGEMTVGIKQKSTLGEPEFNTLDEPIKDTIVSMHCCFYLMVELFIWYSYILIIFCIVKRCSSSRQEIFSCFIP